MNLNLSLLKDLSEVAGIAGWEDRVAELVIKNLEGLVDDVHTDALGNVIAHKKGDGPKVMIAAHMDEIGFYVRHIDDKGYLRVQNVGGFDTRNLFARQVTVHTNDFDLVGLMNPAAKPVHVSTAEERKKIPLISDFFIDTGLTAKEVKEKVRVGDPVTLRQNAEQLGNLFSGKAMDDRSCVFILLETLRALKDETLPYDIYAVFSTQEEVGIRGAATSAYGINPDIGIALDVTLAVEAPGALSHQSVTNLGKGVAIKVMDSKAISDRGLVQTFIALAEESNISHQMEVLPLGGTDASAIQSSRAGVPSIALSVPTRYVHTVTECVHINDLSSTLDLLSAYLKKAT